MFHIQLCHDLQIIIMEIFTNAFNLINLIVYNDNVLVKQLRFNICLLSYLAILK